jgi:hypothetical protein
VIREALSWYCNYAQVALNRYYLKSALYCSNFILHTLIHTFLLRRRYHIYGHVELLTFKSSTTAKRFDLMAPQAYDAKGCC